MDLVEQTTSTTGTGTYTVTGAVAGRQSFAAGLVTDQYVPYVCTDDAGTFECGIGRWQEGSNELQRTVVLTSSNANAAVNWTAGSRRIYVAPHSSLIGLAQVRHNLSAVVAPTPDDDVTFGYGAGSVWIETAIGRRKVYLCVSTTAAGTAWVMLSDQSTETVPRFYFRGAIGIREPSTTYHDGVTVGSFADYSVDNLFADGGLVVWSARTTNATPTKMARDGDYATNFAAYIEAGTVFAFTAVVTASDGAGNRKSWKVEASLYTDAAGTTTTVDAETITEIYDSAGSAAWAIDVVSPGAYEGAIEVTGAAATEIVWSATVQFANGGKY